MLIAMFDQQPFGSLGTWAARLHVYQSKLTLQLFAMQPELEVAFFQHGRRIAHRLPFPGIPDHYCACAIIVFRDRPFKMKIRDRMIFYMHGQPLIRRIKRGTFGNGP